MDVLPLLLLLSHGDICHAWLTVVIFVMLAMPGGGGCMLVVEIHQVAVVGPSTHTGAGHPSSAGPGGHQVLVLVVATCQVVVMVMAIDVCWW